MVFEVMARRNNDEVEAFIIRRAQEQDLIALADVELRSAELENRIEPLTYTLNELTNLWKHRLHSGKFDILVAVNAKNHNQVLAFIGVVAPTKKTGFIQAIYVDPDYAHRGLGQALLEAAQKVFKAHQCPSCELYLEPYNSIGFLFYQKAGFLKTNKKFRHLHVLTKEFT